MQIAATLLLAMMSGSSCASDQPTPSQSPTTGDLIVTIAGLSTDVDAAVSVTGPAAFEASVTESDTLTGLAPGDYTVAADALASGENALTPSPATQNTTLVAGQTSTAAIVYTQSALTLRAVDVATGLSNPVHLTAPVGDTRIFVVEQPGRIRIIKNGALLPTPFLDATSRVNSGGERGLLSVAFDPQYASNGRFYIYYTGSNGDIFIDRHTVSSNPDIASTAFEQVITIQHRMASNHNGGHVQFGPDGMLYIGTGDGGGGGDPQANGQNINSLLGKLLRLNVANLPYTIPSDNPFVNQNGADEIWAYGLRNPWRFAFDGTGFNARLYIADVGQGAWEEVNATALSSAGVNYGWRTMEGAHCYNPSSGCNTTGLTVPVLEYNHSQGCSITGGHVYRGSLIPELRGHYFYADYCGGWVRTFRLAGAVAVDQVQRLTGLGSITSFGVDGAGEIYVLTSNGRVRRVEKQ